MVSRYSRSYIGHNKMTLHKPGWIKMQIMRYEEEGFLIYLSLDCILLAQDKDATATESDRKQRSKMTTAEERDDCDYIQARHQRYVDAGNSGSVDNIMPLFGRKALQFADHGRFRQCFARRTSSYTSP